MNFNQYMKYIKQPMRHIGKLVSGCLILPFLLTACEDGDLSSLEEELLIAQLNIDTIEISTEGLLGNRTQMPQNKTLQLKAVGKLLTGPTPDAEINITQSVKWSVSGSSANINSSGLLSSTGVGGPVDVTATVGTISGSLLPKISVIESLATSLKIVLDDGTTSPTTIDLCRQIQLHAIGIYTFNSDNMTTFEWDESGNVNWEAPTGGKFSTPTSGLFSITSIDDTTATVKATLNSTISGSQPISISAGNNFTGIVISGTTALTPGSSVQLQAIAERGGTTGGDDITQIVAWSDDNSGFAIVNNTGKVTGVTTGTPTIITASCGGGTNDPAITATKSISVINTNELRRIEISKPVGEDFHTINIGDTLLLTATAYYSNGSDKIVTTNDNIIWNKIDITGSPLTILGIKGQYLGKSEGVAEISAKFTENNITVSDDIIVKVNP